MPNYTEFSCFTEFDNSDGLNNIFKKCQGSAGLYSCAINAEMGSWYKKMYNIYQNYIKSI